MTRNNTTNPNSCTAQDIRINQFLDGIDKNNSLLIYKKWIEHLNESLLFPFETEIFEYQEQGSFQSGDILIVEGIEGFDDTYGLIVNVNIPKDKNQHLFPLCDLEVSDPKSRNFHPVDDYNYWYANYI